MRLSSVTLVAIAEAIEALERVHAIVKEITVHGHIVTLEYSDSQRDGVTYTIVGIEDFSPSRRALSYPVENEPEETR